MSEIRGSVSGQPPGRDKFDAWFDDASAERDRLTERVAELVTEGNELRALVGEILDARAGLLVWARVLIPDACAEDDARIARWRERAGLAPAVVAAGAEHLAAQIRGLAIPDEEG